MQMEMSSLRPRNPNPTQSQKGSVAIALAVACAAEVEMPKNQAQAITQVLIVGGGGELKGKFGTNDPEMTISAPKRNATTSSRQTARQATKGSSPAEFGAHRPLKVGSLTKSGWSAHDANALCVGVVSRDPLHKRA